MLKKLVGTALSSKHVEQDDIRMVLDGLRAQGLLAGEKQDEAGGLCSRALLGDVLYNKLHLVCARTDYFGSFDQDMLEQLLSCASVHQYKEQDVVFLQHDPAESIFVILDGSVGLFHKQATVQQESRTSSLADDIQSTGSSRASSNKHHSFRSPELPSLPIEHEASSSSRSAVREDVDFRPEKIANVLCSNLNSSSRSSFEAAYEGHGLNGTLAIIDGACQLDMNRWKRYFCTLLNGKLWWSESRDVTIRVGEIQLAEATACAVIEKDTVGYSRVAAMLDESELADLRRGSAFAIFCHGQCYLFDSKSKKSTAMWVARIRENLLAGANKMTGPQDDQRQERKIKPKVLEWRAKIKSLKRAAWRDVKNVFGEPLQHHTVGESFGGVDGLQSDTRSCTSLALKSCVLVEIHRERLLEMNLWETVFPGSMWTSLHNLLRPEPMERRHSEIDYVLTAVNYMPFFHQFPVSVRRSLLEVCKCHVAPEGPLTVLGQYTMPFSENSSVPMYIVLQGQVDIYQGHTMLSEGIQALSQVAFEDIQGLFPQKVQHVRAEEAWGGPHLIQESGNQNIIRMLDEVVKEVDAKKVKALRNLIKEQTDASTYTLIAEKGTSYLKVEQSDWRHIFSEVKDAVFRMSTLFRILQKPPRERTPQQMRLSTCLLHGFRFFQQLPFPNALDLSYHAQLITVQPGIILAKEGLPFNYVLIFLAGTATVHKSQGPNNLRLPIGPGKSVTLDDARVFFGPVVCNVEEGGSFGTDSLYTGKKCPSNSLVASSRCHILQLPAEEYRAKVGKYVKNFTPFPDDMLATIKKPADKRVRSENRELSECLSKVGLLSQCPVGLLDELRDYIEVISADRGTILAAEGETFKALNILICGSASIHCHHQYQGMMEVLGRNALIQPTPTDTSMKFGLCENVIEVGGSFGELVLASGLPRSDTIIAREHCKLLRLDMDRCPAPVFADLRDFVAASQGVPAGLQKLPEMRSEFDIVKTAGFLMTFDFFKDYSQLVMNKVSKVAEFLSFEKGATIQAEKARSTCLHLVHGGCVEVIPEKDASNVFVAAMGGKLGGNHQSIISCVSSVSVASACLTKLSSTNLAETEVMAIVEAAFRKSDQILSPQRMVPKAKQPRKLSLDQSAAFKPMGVNVFDYGKHFVLGHAKALERCHIIRVNWKVWKEIELDGLESNLQQTGSFLSQMQAFSSWKHKDVAALAERTKVVKFRQDATIVPRGDVSTVLYIVKAGTCHLHENLEFQSMKGVDMMSDDKLYRTSRRDHFSGEQDYSAKITSRKLFRCPNCSTGSITGPGHRERAATKACGMCQGTGSVRSGALSKKSGAAIHSEQLEVSLVSISVGSIVNSTFDKTMQPQEHSIIAGHSCEMYCIDIKDLLDVCDHSPAMLNGIKNECSIMEGWHSRRTAVAKGAHSKLQNQGDVLLHPRPEDDFGGEKPNSELLHKYKSLQPKLWSKSLGSTSLSKSGQTASKLLHIPVPSILGESSSKSIGEKRSTALSLHNMEHIKAKHDAARANTLPVDDEIEIASESDQSPRGLQISRGCHLRSEGDSLYGVDEDEEKMFEESSDDGTTKDILSEPRPHKDPRFIQTFSPGDQHSSGGENEEVQCALAKTAKTEKAISFWDETGKHETMSAHLDMDILQMPGMKKQLQLIEEEEENRRAAEVYNKALGSLMDLHRDLLRSLPKTRSKSQLGSRSRTGQRSEKDAPSKPRSSSVLPSLRHFDTFQHVYSDVKGLDRRIHYIDDPEIIKHTLRGNTPGYSRWQTTSDETLFETLPSIDKTPSRKSKQHANLKQKQNAETTDCRSVSTPTISIQIVDFNGLPSDDKVKKTKIPRGRVKTPRSRMITASPAGPRIMPAVSTMQVHEERNKHRETMSSAGTQGSGMIGWN